MKIKITDKKALWLVAVILNILFYQIIYCDQASDSMDNLMRQLPKMNKYQLQEELNLFEAMQSASPDPSLGPAVILVYKQQIQYHERLADQVRGLIQSGNLNGNVGVDGAVYIPGHLEGNEKVTLLSINEFSTEILERLIEKALKNDK